MDFITPAGFFPDGVTTGPGKNDSWPRFAGYMRGFEGCTTRHNPPLLVSRVIYLVVALLVSDRGECCQLRLDGNIRACLAAWVVKRGRVEGGATVRFAREWFLCRLCPRGFC